MAYASAQDCIDRHGAEALRELADDHHAGTLAWTALELCLSDASDEIDAWLGARHELPLDPIPRIATRLCVEIGIYRRALDADRRTDEQRQRYEDAVALLKKVGSGEASLGAADPDPPSEAEGPVVSVTPGPERVMDRDSLGGIL